MKNKNQKVLRPLYAVEYNDGKTSLVGYYPISWDYVQMSSVNGDRKHPNPHSYETRYRTYPVSTGLDTCCSRYGNYGSGRLNGLAAYWIGPLNDSLPLLTIPSNTSRSACYNKALGRLNDIMRGGLDISVDLAESNQAKRMIQEVHKAERWFSGIGVKRWANEWLQLKYGWMPLLSSVYGAANELIEHAELLSHARGKATLSGASKGTRTVGYFDVTGVSNYTCHNVTIADSSKTKNACLIDVTIGPPNALQKAARWTSLNPLSIAWELTPYSFVVDWFFDVGGYLRDCETAYLFNSRFKSGFKSELFCYDATGKVDFNHLSEPVLSKGVVLVKGESKEIGRVFNRSLLYSYPCPNLPRVNTDLSWNRLITAGALIAQKIDPKRAAKLAPSLSRIL